MGSRGSGRLARRCTRNARPCGDAMTGPRLTGCRCQCPVCGDYFGNVVGFDRHRVGAFSMPGEFAHERRCLTPAELDACGWVRNERGFWLRPCAQRGPASIDGPRVTPPATHLPGG